VPGNVEFRGFSVLWQGVCVKVALVTRLKAVRNQKRPHDTCLHVLTKIVDRSVEIRSQRDEALRAPELTPCRRPRKRDDLGFSTRVPGERPGGLTGTCPTIAHTSARLARARTRPRRASAGSMSRPSRVAGSAIRSVEWEPPHIATTNRQKTEIASPIRADPAPASAFSRSTTCGRNV
jgi:hypothetical protein